MSGGDVVTWAGRLNGLQQYSSAVLTPDTATGGLTYRQLLDGCGIHGCKNAFCAGHSITADNEVLIFGGHADKVQWFRRYNHATGNLTAVELMPSGRWYPTPVTLHDGRVVVVGGIIDSGQAGWHAEGNYTADNPTYTVYNPAGAGGKGTFTEDKMDMYEQLHEAFPIHTYPHVVLLPDGGLAMSAGKTLVKYDQTGEESFARAYPMEDRPGPPWSYPQTGQGTPLPIEPPYDRIWFLASGGNADDRARVTTPASDTAHLIELTGGPSASWEDVGPMPYERVMGDAIVLCDGTIGYFGGAGQGIAGWNLKEGETQTFEFRDGTVWECPEKCSKAFDWRLEPTIYDPTTGRWSAQGSLAKSVRPRLYHSITMLMHDCRVLTSGSDVSWDFTAEFYSPPYLSAGPRPAITAATPTRLLPGQPITVSYTTTDPVTRALLIRNAANTHSMSFDARALWLNVTSNAGGQLTLATPASGSVLPPGPYMLVLNTDEGVPSNAQTLTVLPSSAP
ncbi:kelch domain-containing [Micractinium conductrix]|uniref:Kelch domain-containing n=1 Tax=Micractinium conductrix TaxID=554055 RepID=A0A2P6VRP5_9CHLO|nr:kelch domain-containing [Micractinium conductrix]|eukprot:PSC76751.1 kelch domain-containing [Micractinium conductrix]